MKKISTFILLCVLIIGSVLIETMLMSQHKKNGQTVPPQITKKYFGVSLAGPEFQQAMYPDKGYQGYEYFHKKGLTILRLPFTWERMQPVMLGQLDKSQIAQYTAMVLDAQKVGEQVIIEPHNFGRYNNTPLTTSDSKNFADLWQKLAQQFKSYP